MIRTITKITKEYQTKDYFRANLEEDAAEFMCFLLNHHPWEAFMSVHNTIQVLVGANKSIDYLKNVGEPIVYPIINLTKSNHLKIKGQPLNLGNYPRPIFRIV